MTLAYKILQEHKNKIVETLSDEIRETHPNRTKHYTKCARDIGIVIDAYIAGLRDNTDFEIRYVISKYYDNGKLQLRSLTVELEFHNKMKTIISNLIKGTSIEEQESFLSLSNLFLNELEMGPSEFKILQTEKTVLNRATQYCFYNTPVSDDKIKTILRAANGVTPALCNHYDYRVDVVPDDLKSLVFKSAITIDSDKKFVGNIDDVRNDYEFDGFNDEYEYYKDLVCLNPQVFAPIVLCFSFPELTKQNESWWNSNPVGRDQSFLSMAFNIWHVVLVAEELGLSHAFCAGFDREYAKNTLGLDSSDSDGIWYPYLFLCIGYGEAEKDVHRFSKHNDILNKLILTSAKK